MIDLHSHLIPGVDDGSPSHENSVRVLERMWAEGITEIACTPHLDASRAYAAPVEQHLELLNRLRLAAPSGMKLHSGFEIMLDAPGMDLSGSGLRLGSSRHMLVELPRAPLSPVATDELLRLRATGVVPVIAHPERYRGITIDRLHIWRDMGVVVQGDGVLLLASGSRGDFARLMLTEGVADILASDNHGDSRSLATIRAWLHEVGGDRQATILMQDNPRHVLDDEMLEVVPPLHEHKSMWDRLRELFRMGR